MIVKGHIQKNLRELNAAFLRSSNQNQSYFLSKLAILELCGWIELSMDSIIEDHCRKKLNNPANIKFVQNSIIRPTHGFDYESNFRMMVVKLVGIVSCEKLERMVDAKTQSIFLSQLTSLKTVRNSLAHTYSGKIGLRTNIDAPSVTLARLDPIYLGLAEYRRSLFQI